MPTLVLLALLAVTASARADAFDGLQIAPTVHAASSIGHAQVGLGVDLSIHRWFWIDAWASRVSRPYADRWYPGAWSAGVALNSRVAWTRQAIVYGAGLVYTNAYQCPQSCGVVSAISLEEHRASLDMFAVQLRAGYQLYVHRAWFLRGLLAFELPFAQRKVVRQDRSDVDNYDYHEPPLRFMHAALALTLGYSFALTTQPP